MVSGKSADQLQIRRRMSLQIGVRNYNELSTNAISFGSPEINTHLRNLHCALQSDGYAVDWCSAKRQH